MKGIIERLKSMTITFMETNEIYLEKVVNTYEEEPYANNKLDIIANSMRYYYLLKRHAEKENAVVYPFAEKIFTKRINGTVG